MIKVNDLYYTYPNNPDPTIKGVSFEIEQGNIFGFLGPSGAGKSTVQKVLIKTLSGYTGEVEIKGKDLSDWDKNFYEHVGVGFELPNHYLKLSAKENLDFFASFFDRPTRDPLELLDLVGLKDHANKLVEDYSKGMKMRLNFIRAILHNPEIIFLDEPTSGLDPVNARIMKNIITELKNQGKTIFLTTHNMHDAEELCDKIAFLVDGEIKAIDSPDTLKSKGGKKKVRVKYQNGKSHSKEFDLSEIKTSQVFLDIIQNQDLKSIQTVEASLEDVFIQLTGKQLS